MKSKGLFALVICTVLGIGIISCGAKNEDSKSGGDSSIGYNDNLNINTLDSIKTSIEELVRNYKDRVAVYYYNLNTNEEYSLNKDMQFVAASLKKIPLAMQIGDKLNSGEISLLDTVAYNYDLDFQGGTGILQNEENIGERTIEELLTLSITYSDNIAYNMLNRLCNNTLIDYINTIVSEKVEVEPYVKFSATQSFEILYKLYSNKDVNPYYSQIIELMKSTDFKEMTDKYLPEGTVAHKIGSYYRYYHDAAIISGKDPYILVVLTKDVGILNEALEFSTDEEERNLIDWGEEAWELIARISKEIYDISQVN